MVRNDMTAPASAAGAGYVVLAQKGNGQVEFLYDTDGNGQLDAGPTVAGRRGRQVAAADEVRHAVHRRGLGRRHHLGAGRRRRPSRRPPRCRTSACSSCPTSPARRRSARSAASRSTTTSSRPSTRASPRPSCAGALSDEFDGDRGRRGPLDHRARRADRRRRRAMLPVTNGDIDGTNQGAISYLGQPAPSRRLAGDHEGDADAGQRVAVRRPAPARRRRQLLEGDVHEALERLAVLRVLVRDEREPDDAREQRDRARRHRHDGLRPLRRDRHARCTRPTRTTARRGRSSGPARR